MILTFGEETTASFEALKKLNDEAAIEVCQASFQLLLQNGEENSNKLNESLAQKLDIDLESMQLIMKSLMFVISQAARFSLSETEFRESLSTLGLVDSIQETLVSGFVSQAKDKLRQISSEMDEETNELPIFSNLEWRSEALVSSRLIREQFKPRVILKFEFLSGCGGGGESSNTKRKTYVVLQSDLPNLIHFHDAMEEALAERKSQHILKLLRHFK